METSGLYGPKIFATATSLLLLWLLVCKLQQLASPLSERILGIMMRVR